MQRIAKKYAQNKALVLSLKIFDMKMRNVREGVAKKRYRTKVRGRERYFVVYVPRFS